MHTFPSIWIAPSFHCSDVASSAGPVSCFSCQDCRCQAAPAARNLGLFAVDHGREEALQCKVP